MNAIESIGQSNARALVAQCLLILGTVGFGIYHARMTLKVVPLVWRTMTGVDRWLWSLIVAALPLIGATLAVKCIEAEEVKATLQGSSPRK